MSNGHWRGDMPESEDYNSLDEPATTDDFVKQSAVEVSQLDYDTFLAAYKAYSKGHYDQAVKMLESLASNGHDKNPAVQKNMQLAKQKI